MNKILSLFLVFLLITTSSLSFALERSSINYATGGLIDSQDFKNKNVRVLSSTEMSKVEGEIFPLALAIARLGAYGYRVYTAWDKAKNVTTVVKVVDKAGRSVPSALAESTNAGSAYINYTTSVLRASDIEAALVREGYRKVATSNPSINQFIRGSEKYVLRPTSKSTGTPTLDYYGTSSSIQTVIRLAP